MLRDLTVERPHLASRCASLDDSPALLARFADVLARERLRRRIACGSTNNSMANYSQYLVARAFGLKLPAKFATGHDAEDEQCDRYETKGRRMTNRTSGANCAVSPA
jgi:hypothetical protein